MHIERNSVLFIFNNTKDNSILLLMVIANKKISEDSDNRNLRIFFMD